MEKEDWIENILNSINEISTVVPDDDLFLKIKQKINQSKKVSLPIVWLIAASITALVTLNFALLNVKAKEKEKLSILYLENVLNKNNQLYQ